MEGGASFDAAPLSMDMLSPRLEGEGCKGIDDGSFRESVSEATERRRSPEEDDEKEKREICVADEEAGEGSILLPIRVSGTTMTDQSKWWM